VEYLDVLFFFTLNPNLNKLDPRVLKCVFIGYPHNRKGTNVIIVRVVVSISPWMTHFMRQNPFLSPLHFRGRKQLKRRMSPFCHYHIYLCRIVKIQVMMLP